VSDPRRLGDFLRARRAALSPAMVGLPDHGGPRRVAGLRREEVARLATMSVDYYTRLEQGRVAASAAILPVLAGALLLDEDQTAYLHRLAGKAPARSRRPRPQQVTSAMHRLLDRIVEVPAYVVGRRTDILAWNAAAAALFVDFGALPERERNYVRLLFLDPVVRALHADWAGSARAAVSSLRMDAARWPDDARLAELVGELSVRDEEFRRWWAGHLVSSVSGGTKHYRHATVGELVLDCDTWVSPEDPDQRLVVLSAEPGTPAYEGLQRLGR
jgi:transcriptional regulator with XRE-family HTH domain